MMDTMNQKTLIEKSCGQKEQGSGGVRKRALECSQGSLFSVLLFCIYTSGFHFWPPSYKLESMTPMDTRLTKVHKELKQLKPLTPLTSYNIYFLVERKRILQRTDRPDIPITVKDARDAIEERAKSKEKKRKHRKSHGQISFRDLADLIAERWKDVEDSTKAMLRHEADKERVFFNQQMHDWEKLEKGILSISKTIMQTQSTQAQEKPTKGRFVVSPQDEDGSAESSMEDSFLQKQYEQLHFLISSSPLRQSKGKSIFSDKSRDTALSLRRFRQSSCPTIQSESPLTPSSQMQSHTVKMIQKD